MVSSLGVFCSTLWCNKFQNRKLHCWVTLPVHQTPMVLLPFVSLLLHYSQGDTMKPWFSVPKIFPSFSQKHEPPRKISSTYLLWRLRIFKAFRESYFIERRKRAHSWRTIAFLDGAMTAWANLPISHAALKVSRNSINGEESHKMCQPVENLSLQINAVLPINTFSCT